MADSFVSVESEATFKEKRKENAYMLAIFYTSWCYACKQAFPKIKQVAGDDPALLLCKVDVDDVVDVAFSESIGVVPTIRLYQNDSVYNELCGAGDIESKLPTMIEKMKAVLSDTA
eukprot:GCRY01004857.1.p1 GENE.GCRY01004857.1~~GCRY01004857.1.p1  ORF type:complete len:116 (-),score=9.43 GCRY01004857.1:301-648(-)